MYFILFLPRTLRNKDDNIIYILNEAFCNNIPCYCLRAYLKEEKGRKVDKETKVELDKERVKKRQIYKYRKRILLYWLTDTVIYRIYLIQKINNVINRKSKNVIHFECQEKRTQKILIYFEKNVTFI